MNESSNDTLREQILHYFYDRNTNATSERGKKGSQVKISDVKKELKALYSLSQPQVMSNLTYLIDRHWILREAEQRSFNTGRGTAQPSTSYWYGISADGIEKIEGQSTAFKKQDPFAGINVTAVGSTVQIGNGNYVNAKYRDLHIGMERLREGISKSTAIDDAEKLQAIADIESVKMQLTKEEPDRSLLGSVWPAIERIATAAGLAVDLAAVGALMTGLP